MAESDVDRIRRLTIIALVSDDELMDRLVLKGGNAIRFLKGMPDQVRRSLDLDFSVEGELGPVDELRDRVEGLLRSTFEPEGLVAFDVRLAKAPPGVGEDQVGDFWGGYTLEFKVLRKEDFRRLEGKPGGQSREAIEVSPGGRRTFTVDISKHEWCGGKVERNVDGFRVNVYSEVMLVCEKVRAICQQMPEYRVTVRSGSRRPRARDFFDIHCVATRCGVDLGSDEVWRTLVASFHAKRVPLGLLGRIGAERDFHREDFASVRDTVDPSVELRGFDFYVDFLVEGLEPLKARWEEEPPVG